jgi:hypothetical protein
MFGINVVRSWWLPPHPWWPAWCGTASSVARWLSCSKWRGAAAGSDRPMIWTLLAFATTSLVIATTVAVLFRLTETAQRVGAPRRGHREIADWLVGQGCSDWWGPKS